MQNNNLNPDSINVPTLDTIQQLPTVELPSVDEIQPSQPAAQPAPAVQAQPAAAPVQQPQPAVQSPSFNYGQTPAAPQMQSAYPQYAPVLPVTQNKRTGGQIAALVIGIILTVIFGGLFLLFLIADAATGFEEIETTIIVHVFFGILTIPGIVLIAVGAKKKKTASFQQPNTYYQTQQPYAAAPVQQPYAAAPVPTAPVPTAPVQAAPVPTAPVQTAPVQAAPVPTAPVPTAPVQAAPVPTAPVQAAPVQTAATDTAAINPSAANTSTAFDYAPGSAVQTEDLSVAAKKSARKSAFLSMGIVLVMWIIFFALVFFLQRWVMSWFFLIIPVIVSIGAIKSYPKSVSAWISLIVSVLSILLFIWVTILLQPQF